ncbi:MAG TPA: cytochrome c [Pyrinomonadaceae bacterium]|nr:cytochrome c [Pyrinomonadaceae bacterium]
MRFLKIALVISALFLFILSCDQAPTGNNAANNSAVTGTTNNANGNNANVFNNMPVNIPPDVAQDETASGRKIFMEICSNCHRENGTGGKITIEGKTINPDNLTTDKMKKMADEKYVDYIKNGVPDEGMPAFGDKLSDAEIQNVISFIRKELQK